MFSKLFAPKLQHADPVKRIAALKALTASDEDVLLISQLALTDADKSVREQALDHLDNQITDKTKIDADTAMRLFDIGSNTLKQKCIVHINDQNNLDKCIDATDDEQILMLLAHKSILPLARKNAVIKITDLENLKQLQSLSKDKNVLQVVRQKISEGKAQEKAKNAATQTLEQICEALERLSKSEFESMMVSRVNLLQTHWEEVDEQYKSEFALRYEQAHKQCHQIISQAHEQQALMEFEQSQNEICRVVCEKFETEISALTSEAVEDWPTIRRSIEQQWESCSKGFAPSVENSEKFYMLKSAAEKVESLIDDCKNNDVKTQIDQVLEGDLDVLKTYEQKLFMLTRQLSWPFKIKKPMLFSQLTNQHRQLKNRLQEIQKAQKKQLTQIDSKVTVLKSHIRQKNLIKANRMLNYIQNLIDELHEEVRLKEQDKINPVIISLNDLRGLNQFVTQPKKLDLCDQMEALINKKIAPEKLMDEIKNIQSKWKSLATSDADADDVLWERFKQAADKAYLPCAAYLNDLEKLKNQNLAARVALSEKLEKELGEHSWEHVDWKQVQLSYTQYWKQWRSLSPVFFSQNKPVQKKFETQVAVFKDKLDNEKNENHELYDELINRVGELAESLSDENVGAAIEQVKRIQVSWKNVGITHFNKSRKQWNKFQKTCDKVFEFQRQKHQSLRQQENLQLDQVHDLVNKIKALIKLPDETFADSQADYQKLVEDFELIEVPEFHKEKSQRLFERTCEAYQTHLAGLGKRNKLQAYKKIRQAAALCCKAESLAINGADRSVFEALKADYDALALDKSNAEKFNQRIETASSILDNVENFDQQLAEENELVLSQLAVSLEVLFDLETPDYARKQRMDYQLQQLSQGLKPALSMPEKQVKLLALESDWYQVGALSVQPREKLEQRLAVVIKQAEN